MFFRMPKPLMASWRATCHDNMGDRPLVWPIPISILSYCSYLSACSVGEVAGHRFFQWIRRSKSEVQHLGYRVDGLSINDSAFANAQMVWFLWCGHCMFQMQRYVGSVYLELPSSSQSLFYDFFHDQDFSLPCKFQVGTKCVEGLQRRGCRARDPKPFVEISPRGGRGRSAGEEIW